jgi:hypothetical protein
MTRPYGHSDVPACQNRTDRSGLRRHGGLDAGLSITN